MEFETKRFIQGAREAHGVCVIVDVFRSSNTIIAILDRGAECLIPVACLSVANLIKQENPDYILVGEREGRPPEGFDYDNSPVAILNADLKGETVILATSAGTKALVNARHTDEVVVASFANAHAVADYLRETRPELVTMLPVGLKAEVEAEEDELCAAYIEALVRGEEPDFGAIRERLLATPGADRLRSLGQEADLEFCVELDSFGTVPRASKGLGLWRLRV
jgi:2-phosphosulfolactate phosphatase